MSSRLADAVRPLGNFECLGVISLKHRIRCGTPNTRLAFFKAKDD